ISADADGTLKRWDLARKLGDARYQHSNVLCSAAFAVHDSVVFCAGYSLGVIRIDLPTRTKQTSGLLDFVAAVSPTPDGRRVAAVGCSGSTGCVAMLFDEDLKSLRTWPAAAQLGVWLSPDGEHILFAMQDKTPAVHDAQTGELLWRMPQDDPA